MYIDKRSMRIFRKCFYTEERYKLICDCRKGLNAPIGTVFVIGNYICMRIGNADIINNEICKADVRRLKKNMTYRFCDALDFGDDLFIAEYEQSSNNEWEKRLIKLNIK